MRDLNVALVGYQFMGKAHSNAWLQAPHYFDLPRMPVMHTLIGRNVGPLRKTAERWGWKNYATNYREVVGNPDVHLVDIGSPNDTHAEIAMAAAEAGKAVACEKPLARTFAEAKGMVEAVKRSGVKNFVWFNYRRVPAVAFARQLIERGRIGRIYHARALYLQDWIKDPGTPLVWRLRKKVAGSGSLGDLAAHSVDLLRYLSGEEITGVSAVAKTFVKKRPLGRMVEGLTAAKGNRSLQSSEKRGEKAALGTVDVDDAVAFLGNLTGGGVATFEATRFATGNHNGNSIEINGEKGALRFYFPHFSELEFFDDTLPVSEKGWRTISCTTAEHPYAGAYWPADHPIGYAETFVNTAADIARAMSSKSFKFHPDFVDALETQRVLEAVSRSAAEKRWVGTGEID
ncbi:MAG TPA: Gfo/Idh/MocA family oxidoreductase [Phycisphaerae bacterium]|nr:Gfo/Idh/MocA family oxidoreductase [Phycisphaerae bacterium]